MAFRLNSLELDSNLFLSPLAGYTNLPFRLVIREIGGVGLCTTDLINAHALLLNSRKSQKLIESSPRDRPLAVQLYGTLPEEMRDAALYLQERGVAAVDVNMGCPVPKVCRNGGGSALMNDHAKTALLVKTMVDAVKIPITCKMRLGWDDDNLTAPELARALEEVGVAAITIHGRTREQGFGGRVNVAGIRAVVQAVQRTPVVGNGDITTPHAAKMMFEQTGCAAVGIGRGAFYHPWIFQHTNHYLRTGELLPDPGFDERMSVMKRHLDYMVEVFGEHLGCRMFRKVAVQYTKYCGPSAEFARRVVQLSRRDDLDKMVEFYGTWRRQFLDDSGRLLPRFEPRPALASLDGNGAAAVRVPAGPNERW